MGQGNGNRPTFRVKMTDAPGSFSAFTAEITRVEIYKQGDGWIDVNNESHSYAIMELSNGREKTIAQRNDMKPGTYSKLRITWGSGGSANLTIGGLAVSVVFHANTQTEIDHQMILKGGQTTDVLIDLHAAQSVVQEGSQYIFRPIVTIIQDPETGVRGHVTGATEVSIHAQNGSAMISTFTDANGDFLIRGMDPGMWDLTFYYKTVLGASAEYHRNDVSVVQGSITDVGTITLD